MILKSKSLTKK